MFCPGCNHKLKPVTLPTKKSAVVLDYCAYCGGIWTDRSETNFFEEKDLKSITTLLPKNPKKDVHGLLHCPHDRTKLEDLEHESVPHTITVKHCTACNGNWFPHSQLKKFKHAQQIKLSYHKTWNIPLHSIYAVLLPILVMAILVTGLVGSIIGSRQNQSQQIHADEPMSKPTTISISGSEVMVVFLTQKPVQSTITFWPVEKEKYKQTLQVSRAPKTTHSVKLINLSKTTYSYQITIDVGTQQIYSEIFQFTVEKNQ